MESETRSAYKLPEQKVAAIFSSKGGRCTHPLWHVHRGTLPALLFTRQICTDEDLCLLEGAHADPFENLAAREYVMHAVQHVGIRKDQIGCKMQARWLSRGISQDGALFSTG